MEPTAQHQEIEERFRRMLEDNALPLPDQVEYEPGTVWCLWSDRRVAVAVDFAEDEDGEVRMLAPEPISG